MNASFNGTIRVISARIFVPWRGVWWADLDLDPDDVSAVPTSGPCTLVLGAAPEPVTTLKGTIDPRFSGPFVASSRVRMVGGGGGWDKLVPSKHYHQDSNLQDVDVYTTTAKEVGETVSVASPASLATDFARKQGNAAAVFRDAFWYVEPTTGTTMVAPRPTPTADPSLEILSWDPQGSKAELACDALVLPGTPLVDTESPPRFPPGMTIRDVEQRFDGAKTRATAWCSPAALTDPGTRLASVFTRLVRNAAGVEFLKPYRYRVIQAAAGDAPENTQWALQAVDRDETTGAASPVPDLNPANVWSGMAGVLAQLPPALEVLVVFTGDDPPQPAIVGFSVAKLPLALTLDAQQKLALGPTVPDVEIAGGGSPVARLGDQVQSFLPPTLPVVGTVSGNPFVGTITIASPITGVVTGGSSKASSG